VSTLRQPLAVAASADGERGQGVRKLVLYRQPLRVTWRSLAQGGATAEQMAKINALPQVLAELKPEDVIVRGMYLMNDRPMDGVPWAFTARALADAAGLIIGKPVLRNHATFTSNDLPVGRFFDAGTEQADGATQLWVDFFMGNDPECQVIASRIDKGIIAEVSPTVFVSREACSICGAEDMDCDHVPGGEYEGKKCLVLFDGVSDVWEGSLVWAGQQTGTKLYLPEVPDAEVQPSEVYIKGVSERAHARALAKADPWAFLAPVVSADPWAWMAPSEEA